MPRTAQPEIGMTNYRFWTAFEDQIWDEAQSAWMLMEMAELPSDEEDASRRLIEALDKAPVSHF